MATSFNPNKNPYADDLLRLSNAPKSRFTPRERYLSASLLAGKLYGLELEPLHGINWWSQYGHLFFQGNNRPVLAEVLFESESHTERLSELQYWASWAERYFGESHVLVLKAGHSGVSELHNGQWDASQSWDSIAAKFQLPDALGSSADPGSDSIPPRSDEEASSAYFGGDTAQSGAGGGGDDDGLRRGGGDGGDGGFGRGNGGGGDQAPGAGGVRELVNHPVLFTVDEDTLRAILENA